MIVEDEKPGEEQKLPLETKSAETPKEESRDKTKEESMSEEPEEEPEKDE